MTQEWLRHRDHDCVAEGCGAMTPDPLDLDAFPLNSWCGYTECDWGDLPDNMCDVHAMRHALIAEGRRLRAEVARLRAVGEDDIATWAEYVTGKKWAPVEAGPNG